MIHLFNETLEAMLQQEPLIRNSGVQIDFHQPTREWSSQLSGPTLNIYLYDIRENNKLRGKQPGVQVSSHGNRAQLSRQNICINLHYMITAWISGEDGEHELLSFILLTLLRNSEIPHMFLQQYMPDQAEDGVSLQVAQYDTHVNPRDLWSVLDNEMRPAIDMVATITMNPYPSWEATLTERIDIRYHQILDAQPAE